MHSKQKARGKRQLRAVISIVAVAAGFTVTKNLIYSNMEYFLDGTHWSYFCVALSWMVSILVWFFVIPDMLYGMKIRKASRVDGSHDRI